MSNPTSIFWLCFSQSWPETQLPSLSFIRNPSIFSILFLNFLWDCGLGWVGNIPQPIGISLKIIDVFLCQDFSSCCQPQGHTALTIPPTQCSALFLFLSLCEGFLLLLINPNASASLASSHHRLFKICSLQSSVYPAKKFSHQLFGKPCFLDMIRFIIMTMISEEKEVGEGMSPICILGIFQLSTFQNIHFTSLFSISAPWYWHLHSCKDLSSVGPYSDNRHRRSIEKAKFMNAEYYLC